MRLFVAIEPTSDLRQALLALRCPLPNVRWLPPEQLHLTMAFLGEVAETQLDQLCRRLATVAAPRFDLAFDRTGCFPNPHNPRVLWVGCTHKPLLDQLARDIGQAALACGIRLEERPFHPHITVARVQRTATAVDINRFLEMPHAHKLPSLAVQEFVLYRSNLSKAGAVHTAVRRFFLSG